MKIKIRVIALDPQPDTAKPQHYSGPQIIELVAVMSVGGRPSMVVIVDESINQECDQFVLLDGQGFDPSARSPGGDPIRQDNRPKTLGAVNTLKGVAVVASYCFA